MLFKFVQNWFLVGLVAIAIVGIAPKTLAQFAPDGRSNPSENLRDPAEGETPPDTVKEPIFDSDGIIIPDCPLPVSDVAARENGAWIETISVRGYTILEEEITREVRLFEQNYLTFEDLECLTERITFIYEKNGYITTGALILKDTALLNGIANIKVVEGIAEIKIEGLQRLQENYIRSRIQQGLRTPFHLPSMEAALQSLLREPFIEGIKASLDWMRVGTSILRVRITEAPAFRPSVSFDNYLSPSTGAIEASFLAQYDNLWGRGDRAIAGYGFSEGFHRYDFGYALPLNSLDGTLSLRYVRSDSHIIEEDFRNFGIRGEEELFSIGFRQPLYQKPLYQGQNRHRAIGITEFALGLSFDLRRSQTFLFDDIPFSFARGAERGESKVSVLRFSQEWLARDTNRIFFARSQFNFGLDAFDATVNNTGTDGRFFSWQGDFIWRQQLSSQQRSSQQLSPQFSLIARLSAQLTPDSLLPIERFSLGGTNNLKGYRPGLLSGDNGIWASLEVPISLSRRIKAKQDKNREIEEGKIKEYLQIIPSLAIGTVWNNDTPNPNSSTLASLGLGLRWQVVDNLFVHLDYGIPLITLDNRGSSLQDRGLFFALRYEF